MIKKPPFLNKKITIYAYGYLGGKTPLTIYTSILMRGLTIKGLGNFTSKTVQNPENLEKALKEISSIMDMPHFKTEISRKFKVAEINDALAFSSAAVEKAVLYLFL